MELSVHLEDFSPNLMKLLPVRNERWAGPEYIMIHLREPTLSDKSLIQIATYLASNLFG